MAEVLVLHHVQGLTDGVRALADDLAIGGHTVHTPDLFDGREFRSIEAGLAYVQEIGSDEVTRRGEEAAAAYEGTPLVYAGISFGAAIAQALAQTTTGARGALLLEACLPAEEFDGWPADLPAQIHGMVRDPYFADDLAAARAIAEGGEHVQLFEYDGSGHLFTDPSLGAYEPRAYAQMLGRALAFLGGL